MSKGTEIGLVVAGLTSKQADDLAEELVAWLIEAGYTVTDYFISL